MKGLPEERAVRIGEYLAETRATVRTAAKRFGVSKSTVHKDVSERLKKANAALFMEVKGVLEQNKKERHLRGGAATKRKYEKEKNPDKKTE